MSIHIIDRTRVAVDRAHETLADHALLVAEGADVLYDMATQPSSRGEDLVDLEAIHAEGKFFATTSGLGSVVASMFTDVVDLGRRLARQQGVLPTSMIAQTQVVRKMARTVSDALENGSDASHVRTLNRCANALQEDAAAGTDLLTSADAARQALHAMLQGWALGI